MNLDLGQRSRWRDSTRVDLHLFPVATPGELTLEVTGRGVCCEFGFEAKKLLDAIDEVCPGSVPVVDELESSDEAKADRRDSLALFEEYDEKALEELVERLRKALAFAASVIKSGEAWSETCEEMIGSALASSKPEGEPCES